MLTKLEKVYIGEVIIYHQNDSETTTLVSPNKTKKEISGETTAISTELWEAGLWTQIIKTDMSISDVIHFTVIDPIASSEKYQELLKMLDDIDQLIKMRIAGGLITTTSINNKTLVNESLDVLYRLKDQYTKQANKELLKLNGKPDYGQRPIKSITKLHRKE
ncbi:MULTISPECIES: hypothetical protein [Serratia]|uniref:Uncharacterized protein n=1 Tax=Serratia quinivorans TaxID=137545 RepID=A0A380AH94_9GAMM|nr:MULTISPECIES: hypothetical protein [Serratia]RYM64681.1 hypothetical protein BSR03_03985 [Serratia proteamaculans]CAI1549837.1 Uncharacterised protein [Serratia quinivorans]SUI80656.1 Uncharacterised protein [Serratia quinivorans]